jgi:hypothetical protein
MVDSLGTTDNVYQREDRPPMGHCHLYGQATNVRVVQWTHSDLISMYRRDLFRSSPTCESSEKTLGTRFLIISRYC